MKRIDLIHNIFGIVEYMNMSENFYHTLKPILNYQLASLFNRFYQQVKDYDILHSQNTIFEEHCLPRVNQILFNYDEELLTIKDKIDRGISVQSDIEYLKYVLGNKDLWIKELMPPHKDSFALFLEQVNILESYTQYFYDSQVLRLPIMQNWVEVLKPYEKLVERVKKNRELFMLDRTKYHNTNLGILMRREQDITQMLHGFEFRQLWNFNNYPESAIFDI